MIKNSFIFIPGIGEKTEEAFWKKGILTWDDFQEKSSILNLSVSKKKNIGDCLDKAKEALESKPVFSFFAANLPQREHWRIYKEAGNKVLFLDIETTGLSLYYNKITLIGTFDGHKVKVFIRENNLEEFLTYIQNYDLIVTFNGKLFDVPFIKKEFPATKIPPIHIDLRYLLRSLGITGPLKKIEEQLGVRRPEELKEINGRIATILWSRFKKGDDKALEKLVLYNIYDVVNLQTIMHLCYQQKVKEFKIKINPEKINHKMALSRLEACPTNQTEHFAPFDDLPSFNVPKIITRYSHNRVMEAYLNEALGNKEEGYLSLPVGVVTGMP